MPGVEKEGLKSKVKNVAKKSTTKRTQFRNYTHKLKERDLSTVSIVTMTSTDTSNVYEETLDNLKSLNSATVKESWDKSNTKLEILSTESVQDNGLLDKNPTEDAVENVSTDEEDNLLNLSDAESQDINLKNDIEKYTDTASQLAIGVQVRNSVRDIMSKLVQDGSPEVNKILAKPKGDDNSRTNSPKTIKPCSENKSDLKSSNKIIKGNLFEIMSAESKSDDIILESSSKSNILSVEVGEDTNNSSVSMETTPQSNTNTQDNSISSLFLSDQISVTYSSVDALSANNSVTLNNSVSTTNALGSSDSSDNVSDILESVDEDSSNSCTLLKLKSDQDKILNRADRNNATENKTLRNSNLFSNFETPTDSLISNTNINNSNDVENSENILKNAENLKRNNLETVDMDISNDKESFKVCEIPSKTVQSNNDISDSNYSGNNKSGSLPLDSKLGTYSDDDILDLNENLDSPKPEYSKTVDVEVGDVTNKKDDPEILSGKKTDSKSNSFDNNEGTIKQDHSKSVNPFQFSVDDDDNSNSNLFAKIDIDEICDHLLMDEPKTDVSVNNKVVGDKVVDEKGDNEIMESQDLGVEIDKTSLDMASNEKEESIREANTIVTDEQKPDDKADLKNEDSISDGGKIQKPENMDIDDTVEDKLESTSKVESHKESNGSTSLKHESMDINGDFKSEIKTDADTKKVIKIDFSPRSDKKFISDQNDKVKQDIKDNKSDIKVAFDKEKCVKEEKTDSKSMDYDNIKFNSLSKSEVTTTFGNMDSKSVKLDNETKKEKESVDKSDIVVERKRSGESPNTESQAPPKRSRLDIMIGKLGSQIGIAPESVPDPIDCDTLSDSETESKEGSEYAKSEDEESKSMVEDDDAKTIYEEVKKKEDFSKDSIGGATITENASSVKVIKDEKEKQEAGKEMTGESPSAILEPKRNESLKEPEEVNYSATTISDDEDDDDVKVIEEPIKSSNTIQSVKNQDITYDSEVNLDQVIRERVLQLIKSYRDETIAALQTKVKFLTKSTEQWKNTSKDLQKQVVDLTIVQQRLDKRKAATAALKSITSRSIGCQVDNTKLQNGSDMIKSPPKPGAVKYTSYSTSPAGQNMVSMIKPPTRPTPAVTTPIVNNMSQLLSATAESRNTNINNVRQGAGVSSVRNLLETTGRANLTQTSTAKNVSYSGKVIDLTADNEENTKKLSNSQAKTPIMLPVSNLPLGSSPLPGLPPGASILLSGPSGTQIVNHQFNKMSGALQVVTVSSGSQIRPGQFLTVVPSTATTGGNIRPQPVTMTTTVPSVTSIGTTPVRQAPPTNTAPPPVKKIITSNHPAPLPPQPVNRTPNGGVKGLVPPKPDLKISRVSQGIVLSWTITQNLSLYSEIASYQLFAYQEGSTPPHSNLWKKVGDVKALPLPMACTLTQFQEGNKYHFAVRAIDVYQRISEFSEPSSIHLFAL